MQPDTMTAPAAAPADIAALRADQLRSWATGIGYEIDFWTRWGETAGMIWPADYAARMNPQTPVLHWLPDHARALGRTRLDVLDVGAGPVTLLGHASPPGLDVRIVATDPLAHAYAALFDRLGMQRPNPPAFAPAEYLSAFFAPSSFDIVHCSNALDHAFDPLEGFIEMLRVVRVGGMVVMDHGRNEAEAERYTGFHQHNFDVEDGRFIIWKPGQRVDVGAVLPVEVELGAFLGQGVHIRCTKRGEFPPEEDGRHRALLRDTVEGMMRFLTAQAIEADLNRLNQPGQ